MKRIQKVDRAFSILAVTLVIGAIISIYFWSNAEFSDDQLQSKGGNQSHEKQQGKRKTTRNEKSKTSESPPKAELGTAAPAESKDADRLSIFPTREQLLADEYCLVAFGNNEESTIPGHRIEYERSMTRLVIRFEYEKVIDPKSQEKREKVTSVAIVRAENSPAFERSFLPVKEEVNFNDKLGAVRLRGLLSELRVMTFSLDRYEDDPDFPWTIELILGVESEKFVIGAKKVKPPPPPMFGVYEEGRQVKPYSRHPHIRGSLRYDENFIGFGGYELVIRQGDQLKEIFDAKIEPKSKNYISIDSNKYPSLRGQKRLLETGYWIRFEVPSEWRLKDVVCELTFLDLTGKRFEYESKIKWDKRPGPR